MADLGIEGEVQHESYIASWLKELKNDKRYIFKAVSAASKAHRYFDGQNLSRKSQGRKGVWLSVLG